MTIMKRMITTAFLCLMVAAAGWSGNREPDNGDGKEGNREDRHHNP